MADSNRQLAENAGMVPQASHNHTLGAVAYGTARSVVSPGGIRSHGENCLGSDRGPHRVLLPAWLAEYLGPGLGA